MKESEYIYDKGTAGLYNHIEIFTLEPSELKSLARKTLEIKYYKTKWYKFFQAEERGETKIKLDPLANSSEINGSFNIALESKREGFKIDISIKLRQPIKEKEYNIESQTVLAISKVFPPFKGEGSEAWRNKLNKPDSKTLQEANDKKQKDLKDGFKEVAILKRNLL